MAHSAINTPIVSAIPVQPSAAGRSLPVLKPGFRLVPTLIGRPGNEATVWIECPEWCTLDHANDRQIALEDVWHSGEFVDLELPHRGGTELLAYFRLGLDPYSRDADKRRTFVYAEDGTTPSGYYMEPDHLDAAADRLEVTAAQLRALARAARATMHDGDSDPDMDEALRRVREGRA
jgi:hypothetical protein